MANDQQILVTDGDGNAFILKPINCPICERPALKVLGYRGGPTHRYGLGVPSRIKRCESCGLIFPDPFPYPVDTPTLYGDPEKYFERHDQEGKVRSYSWLVGRLKALSGVDDPTVLDIGSGRGELLEAARLEGLSDVTGLELSDAMVRAAHDSFGVSVLQETVEVHAARVGRTYDVFVLGAVLEHVHDPNLTVASVAKLARPGSVLFIDVPNEPNLMTTIGNGWNRLSGRKSVYNLSPTFLPFHVWGFNLPALRRLLDKHGFRIEESTVRADPNVPSSDSARDRFRSLVATQLNRVANHTGTAANLTLWARKV